MDSFTWGDILSAIYNALATAWSWIVTVVNWVAVWLQYLINVATFIWNALVDVAKKIIAGFTWLTHLSFSSLWSKLKSAYDRYRRFRKWWQQHIQGPVDAYRKQILKIYRQFFKPIISVIEAARSAVRTIAVFDRKLAAKLDSKLWALEGWILTPITRALRAVNGMASMIYAVLTATGRIDGTVFIATVSRHITEIRAALFGLPWSNKTPPADTRRARNAQVALDVHNWCKSGGGPIQDGVDAMASEFQEAYTLMGSFHG